MKWMTASKASRNALIEQKRREGATLAALAAEFSVSPTTISQVLAKIERNRRVVKLRLEAPLRRVTKPYEGE
jgi:DNA-binding MarR family transcriptional regulator